MQVKIFIDNGHGNNTPGHRSPDGEFSEAQYTRQIAVQVVSRLKEQNQDATLLVPEEEDIPLSERCKRVNTQCLIHGRDNNVLISIHIGTLHSDGAWHESTGWCIYNTLNDRMSETLSTCLINKASQYLQDRCHSVCNSGAEHEIETCSNFLNGLRCPAAVTINLSLNNRRDVDYLTSPEGREAIIRTHVEGILDYISQVTK